MPRAKRTDRAEARRRYRASIGEPLPDAGDAPEPEAGPRGTPTARPATAVQRPGIGAAFRGAFRPLTLREDMRTFPRLLTHRAVWLPSLLTILAGAAFLATNGGNALVGIIATYFVAPPALGSVFIGGFLAPRASYFVGFVVGIVSAIVAAVIIASTPVPLVPSAGQPAASPSPSASAAAVASGSPAVSSPNPSAVPSPSGSAPAASAAPTPTPTGSPTPVQATSVQDQIIYAFITSPPFGLLFASAAAWYRRFLRLSNPNRGRPQQQRRGPDGKSRGNQRRR